MAGGAKCVMHALFSTCRTLPPLDACKKIVELLMQYDVALTAFRCTHTVCQRQHIIATAAAVVKPDIQH